MKKRTFSSTSSARLRSIKSNEFEFILLLYLILFSESSTAILWPVISSYLQCWKFFSKLKVFQNQKSFCFITTKMRNYSKSFETTEKCQKPPKTIRNKLETNRSHPEPARNLQKPPKNSNKFHLLILCICKYSRVLHKNFIIIIVEDSWENIFINNPLWADRCN